MCKQHFSEIGQDKWKSVCDHVREIEAGYRTHEGAIDAAAEQLIVNLGEVTDTSSDTGSSCDDSSIARSDGVLSGIGDCHIYYYVFGMVFTAYVLPGRGNVGRAAAQ